MWSPARCATCAAEQPDPTRCGDRLRNDDNGQATCERAADQRKARRKETVARLPGFDVAVGLSGGALVVLDTLVAAIVDLRGRRGDHLV
jgi:hypothetical protein